MHYDQYDIEDFLDDPLFISWVKEKTPESDDFWTNWIQSNPPNLEAFKKAELQLKAMLSIDRMHISEGGAEEVWDRIQTTIHSPSGKKVIVMAPKPWYRQNIWRAAAAAVFIFACMGYWAWQKSQTNPDLELANNKPSEVKQEILPGGNKALLILADGSSVVLDSANNGAITHQGGTTVIKLDGLVTYNQSVNRTNEVVYNTISTPRGGQYQLILADGTKVWLNSASSLKFPTSFPGHQRRVELNGEGYFEVAHNPSQPFFVSNGGTEVKVLGTHFNVMAYGDEPATLITLLEGRVSVSHQSRETNLLPGQQAKVTTEMKVLDNVDEEQVMAWKNGSFIFGESMSIPEIMRQVARWYDVEIEYQRKPAGHIGGSISKQVNISEVLSIIELTGEVRLELQGKKVIVK